MLIAWRIEVCMGIAEDPALGVCQQFSVEVHEKARVRETTAFDCLRKGAPASIGRDVGFIGVVRFPAHLSGESVVFLLEIEFLLGWIYLCETVVIGIRKWADDLPLPNCILLLVQPCFWPVIVAEAGVRPT